MVRGGYWFPVLLVGFLALAGCASREMVEESRPVPQFVVQSDMADGQVLRGGGGNSNEVYINLGRNDRVRVGMVFTAYDPRIGVNTKTPGNGSLEIIEVAADYSICRVRQTAKNRAIGPHDLVFNSVYHHDKNRALHFAVSGAFDLNGDGVPTAAEREQVEYMITARGGQIDRNVTRNTNYLIAGTRPASAIFRPLDASTTVPGGIVTARDSEQLSYDDQIVTARQWAIPVLNTNRFLQVIGGDVSLAAVR